MLIRVVASLELAVTRSYPFYDWHLNTLCPVAVQDYILVISKNPLAQDDTDAGAPIDLSCSMALVVSMNCQRRPNQNGQSCEGR